MFPKMSCFWALLTISLSFAIINTTSQSKPTNHHHHHHKSHTVVIGTVYSPSTCLQLKNIPKPTHYFITVECWKETGSRWRFRQIVKTDSHGGFKLHLHFPFLFTKCCFTYNNNYPATCTNPRLVGSRRDGTRVVSTGLLALACTDHDNSFKKISQISNPSGDPAFLPPILGSFLPPLPQLPPLPSLPRLPPLPGIPFLPPVKRAAKPSENNQPETFPFPPNPFNIPILQTPPLTIPPLVPLPDSPPLFNLPPLPGLIQSPPPPALPPPLQLPPFPFQPTPGFPGVPPTQKNISP